MEDKLSGPEKAAVLLLRLGEEIASEVFRNLDEEEIQGVCSRISQLKKIPSKIVDQVLEEFITFSEGKSGFFYEGEKYLKKVLSKALGEKKAENMLENLSFLAHSTPFASLKEMSPEALANYLRVEHPQTIAGILAFLDPERSARVLSRLPQELQVEVVLRIANLEQVSPEMVEEVEKVLANEITEVEHKGATIRRAGGIQLVADILNQVDRATEGSVLSGLEEIKPELAEEVKQLMFVFEDLILIDDRGIQALLKEITKEDLVLALKTASETIKEKILKNMSERARVMLMEDFEALGPARLRDVEKAQQNILRAARRLEEKGEVIIKGRGEKDALV